MTARVLLLILASLTSNIVRRNFVNYSCLGPHYESWIGSSAFSAAAAVFIASFVVFSHRDDEIPTVVLYTYYTGISLLASVLILKLVWVPLFDLVGEMNLILSKTALYINKTVCPDKRSSCLKDISLFLRSTKAVVWSTNFLGVFLLYLMSTDILHYIAMYFYTLTGKGILEQMRSATLRVIDTLLHMTSSKKRVRFHGESEIKYYSPSSNK